MTAIDHLLETVACDLCRHHDDEFLYTKRGVLSNHPFRVVRCRSCGLMYLNPRLCERAIADLYDRAYYDGTGFDSHVNYIVDFEKHTDADKVFRPEETVKTLKTLIAPPAILLDFGCGLGDLMRQATRHGYTAEGFEVSRFAADNARRVGCKIYADLVTLPHDRYDIVSAVEVFEHCHSPMAAMTAIYRSLKPGGYLYYTTANFDGFYRKWRLGIKPALDGYIVPEGHIYFFSTEVMKAYFKTIGFTRVMDFEPKVYQRGGRLFRTLSRLGLIGEADGPTTVLEQLAYYGGRKVATVLGLRERPLPLAIK